MNFMKYDGGAMFAALLLVLYVGLTGGVLWLLGV